MAYVVTQNCCNDATCVAVCPVNCIHPTPEEREYQSTEMLYIDAGSCIDCGACADVCPVDAIVPEDALTERTARYLEINAEYFAAHPRNEPPGAHVQPGPRGTRDDETPLAPLRVAIVGSGPSAFYAAEELFTTSGLDVEVTMFERLPVAGGLVRFGVAPDHANTKSVARVFDRTARRDGFTFLLDVEVGRDVTTEELLNHHHAVLYASGASDDRRLGIEGEDLPGSYAAREFVAWYNGHPDHADATFDLSSPRAVVIGNGNVALDVARILVSDPDVLRRTDIADHALAAFEGSDIEEVVVLGRRGPEFTAATTPELLALDSLPGIDVVVEGPVNVDASSTTKTRLLAEYAARQTDPEKKRIILRFDTTPLELLGSRRVEKVRVAATSTGEVSEFDAGFVLRSIGYRGRPVDGLPYDMRSGTVPNSAGRVQDPGAGTVSRGLYVAGWIKRGPTGVIGTNRYCAGETVRSIVEDHRAGRLGTPMADVRALHALILQRRPSLIDGNGWRAIDRHELESGRRQERPRVKLVDRREAAAIAHAVMESSPSQGLLN
jgi:ferredoxin--NADP+ reductase